VILGSRPSGNNPTNHATETEPNPRYLAPCTCGTLRRASRAVTNLYDLVLAPSGLRLTQFLVLKALHEEGRVAQCDFAREHDIAVETLSRRFGALRRKGLVEMHMGDRHGERVYNLTAEGHEAFLGALPYWERAQERLSNVLGEPDVRKLLEMCERVRQAAHSAENVRAKNHAEINSLHSYSNAAAD
jgi:DNA-binding MarR family transcriptional regulator